MPTMSGSANQLARMDRIGVKLSQRATKNTVALTLIASATVNTRNSTSARQARRYGGGKASTSVRTKACSPGRYMEQSDLPFQRFAAALDSYPGIRHIELQGEGEPLLHPRFLDYAHASHKVAVFVRGLVALDQAFLVRRLDPHKHSLEPGFCHLGHQFGIVGKVQRYLRVECKGVLSAVVPVDYRRQGEVGGLGPERLVVLLNYLRTFRRRH